MKKINSKKIFIVCILFALLCSCANEEKTDLPVAGESVVSEENSIEEPIIVSSEVEEIQDEEIVTDTTVQTVAAPSYKLHIGVADGITLSVNRIYSEYGAVGEVVAEVTKLYEGDILSVSVTTIFNLEPIYCVHDATRNDDNTFTICSNDATITTGYKANDSMSINKQVLHVEMKTRSGNTKIKIAGTAVLDAGITDPTGTIYQYEVNAGQRIDIDLGGLTSVYVYRYNINSQTVDDKESYSVPSLVSGMNVDTDSYFVVESGYGYYICIDTSYL